MVSHTSGEWIPVAGDMIRADGNGEPEVVAMVPRNSAWRVAEDWREREANILVAAAGPKLLEALQWALDEFDADPKRSNLTVEWAVAARAAIAKAKVPAPDSALAKALAEAC